MDLVLVVDSSGSIRRQNNPSTIRPDDPDDNWQRMMTFLWDLTWQFTPSLRVGVVKFSDTAEIVSLLTDVIAARNVIQNMRQNYEGGAANTAMGIRQALEVLRAYGNRPAAHDAVIVFTDGYPTINVGDVEFAARDLRNSNAFIGLVGIGGNSISSRDDYIFQRITERDSQVIFVPNFSDLPNKVAATASMLCTHLLNQAGGCVQPNCPTNPTPITIPTGSN